MAAQSAVFSRGDDDDDECENVQLNVQQHEPNTAYYFIKFRTERACGSPADEQELMDAGVGTEEHNGDVATRRGPREAAAASSSRRPLQRGSPRGPQPGSSAGWKMTEDKGERPDPSHRGHCTLPRPEHALHGVQLSNMPVFPRARHVVHGVVPHPQHSSHRIGVVNQRHTSSPSPRVSPRGERD